MVIQMLAQMWNYKEAGVAIWKSSPLLLSLEQLGTWSSRSQEGAKPTRAGPRQGAGGGGPYAQEKQKAGQPATCEHRRGTPASAWLSDHTSTGTRPALTKSISSPGGPEKDQTLAFQSRGRHVHCGQGQVTKVLGSTLQLYGKVIVWLKRTPELTSSNVIAEV